MGHCLFTFYPPPPFQLGEVCNKARMCCFFLVYCCLLSTIGPMCCFLVSNMLFFALTNLHFYVKTFCEWDFQKKCRGYGLTTCKDIRCQSWRSKKISANLPGLNPCTRGQLSWQIFFLTSDIFAAP